MNISFRITKNNTMFLIKIDLKCHFSATLNARCILVGYNCPMEHLLNLMNQRMPEEITRVAAYLYTTPGHILMFIFLVLLIVVLRYLFRGPIRRWIKMRLYKKRKELLYRLMFYRLEKILHPFRLIISMLLLEKALDLFDASETMNLLFFAVYAILIAWWTYEIVKFLLYFSLSLRIEKQQSVRRELFNLILNIVKIILTIIVVLVFLSKMGVDVTGLITSLGVGGIVIGFSAKDTLTNFFDSIRLVGENAFNLGDWIETKELEGYVVEIGLAATRIRTFDNALVTIPNSKLAADYIKNWSKRVIGRRIKFHLKLTYTYDTREIDRVLFEIRDMLEKHPDIVNDNKLKYLIKMRQTHEQGLFNIKHTMGVQSALMVYLDQVDTYSMDILVYAYAISVKWEEWLHVKQDVLKKVIEVIDGSELELAIPQEQIFIASEEDKQLLSAYQSADNP